jgi:site-specific recombinase XerD
MPADVEGVDAPHIRAYLLHEEQRTSAVSAAHHFRNIRVFFGWLASEGERENPNPMDRVEAPKVTKKAKAFFTDDELAALLKTCSGSSFVDRRDTAIMRIFIDTGIRVSGLASLRYDPDDESANDVFLAQRRLRIRLKGGDETWVPIGKKAAASLDKYIRARARHPQASSPWLWVGVQGHNTAHMTDSGIRDMVGAGASRRGFRTSIRTASAGRSPTAGSRRAGPPMTSCTSRAGRRTTWSASTPRRAGSLVPTTPTPASAQATIYEQAYRYLA